MNHRPPEYIHPNILGPGKQVLARRRDSLNHNPNNQHLKQPTTQRHFAKLDQLLDLGPHRYNEWQALMNNEPCLPGQSLQQLRHHSHLRQQLLINKVRLSLVRPVISETNAIS